VHRIKCENCKKKFYGAPTLICECGFRHVNHWTGKIPPSRGWLQNARVGWLQGPLIETLDKDFVVASIDSVSQCNYAAELLKEFGLVIIDEMHHLGALTLSQVLPKIPSKYVLGISATPDRNDGLEHVLYWLAGPTSFVYKRLPSITGLTRTVEVRQHLFTGGNRTEVIYKGGKIGFAAMINALAADEERNAYILSLAGSAVEQDRKKLLIVTSIVDHAKLLGSQLNALVIHGGCSPALVSQAKSAETRIVVATYQFLEEGYDDPRLDTLIMALPRSKIQQVVGRCERTHDKKLVPEIHDIVDTFSVFEPMSWKRHHFYKSRGFGITRK
jgi:superfamily II DNA or RNA helicase